MDASGYARMGGYGKRRKHPKVVHITDCHDEHHLACSDEDQQHFIDFGGNKHDDDYHDDYHDYHDYHDDHSSHDDHYDYHYDDHDDHHGGGYSHGGGGRGYKLQKPKVVIIKKIIDQSTTTVPTG